VSLKAGQVIAGKYRLNALLGTGGMASVWSATNTFTERQFAIKFLLPTFAKTPEAAQRFLMEAKVSGRVQHPNIIEVLDVGQAEDGSLFLVMELLQGDSLEHAMRKQEPPMTLYEFVGVMLDVARALSAAHRGGVVHRDLKPSNILLHKDSRGVAIPKVLDFGVSKFLLETDRDNSLTIAGTVLGSPLYMSPEQAMGQLDIDHRTDVFAFGAILFEGVCGYRCFDAPNFNALIVMIATQQPKSVDHCSPQTPDSVRALIRDCLVTDKNQRIESFDRIIERMTPLLAELERNPTRLPKPARRHGESPTDPEGTAAMPAIIRPSDRPPPMGPDQAPTSGSAAPWAGSLPGYRPVSKPPVLLFAVGGAAFASLVIVAGLALVFFKRHVAHDDPVVAAPPTVTAPPQPTATQPVATASASDDVPVISVDSLPMAPSSRHVGRLSVEASPQACTLSIDGKPRGTTPTSLDVSPGAHSIRCETSSGIAKIVSVSVVEGQTAHHHFTTNP
jgi:eukaryotic-like serine/threonine-protein kinase